MASLSASPRPPRAPDGEFTPKLVTVLREGYRLDDLRADAVAGLTVAVVALPLSMAIAIASGASPERGLVTAIIGGFLISLLGGSRHQIGGPAGAFIVLVAATIEAHGYAGLLTATLLAGAIMLGIGATRLGGAIRYIPHPVMVGFTAGIAVIIFASQMKDLLGLTLAGKEPAALLPKLQALAGALHTVNPAAVALSLATLALILGIKRWRPALPNLLIAVALAGAATALLGLPVETIGSRFGAIPASLPPPALPPLSLEMIERVWPNAVAIALLGSIESLLSAVVADGMTGRKHRSNGELVAQGIANMATALFGGIVATGTIARTATNVRAGARGPVAGMLHAVFLLAFMLLAAPVLGHVPLAALAAVLTVVAWNMAEKREFWGLLTRNRAEGAVLAVTFLLTIFRDLTEGIVVGVLLGCLLFVARMARAAEVELAESGLAPGPDVEEPIVADAAGIVTYRLSGPLFFGAAPQVADVLERIGVHPRALVLDLAAVTLLDSSGVETLRRLAVRLERQGTRLVLVRVPPATLAALAEQHVGPPLVTIATDQAAARRLLTAAAASAVPAAAPAHG
jgi:SulP family sulfate permease